MLLFIFIIFIIILFLIIFVSTYIYFVRLIDKKYFIFKSVLCLIILVYIVNFFLILFNLKTIMIIINCIFLLLFIFKILSNVKSDKVNDDNVILIFYKPIKIKELFLSLPGLCYASAGLVINKNIYQLKRDKDTLQKIPFRDTTLEYLREKYLIIDTGFKYKNLQPGWEENLLSQHAKQKKTLYFRFNCLRSLRYVLESIPNYKYKGEILPCIYLVRVIYISKIYRFLKYILRIK